MNVILLGKRVFADIIKLTIIKREYCGPKSIEKCPYKRYRERKRHKQQRRGPCEDRGRGQSDAALRNIVSHQKLGKARIDSILESSEKAWL